MFISEQPILFCKLHGLLVNRVGPGLHVFPGDQAEFVRKHLLLQSVNIILQRLNLLVFLGQAALEELHLLQLALQFLIGLGEHLDLLLPLHGLMLMLHTQLLHGH